MWQHDCGGTESDQETEHHIDAGSNANADKHESNEAGYRGQKEQDDTQDNVSNPSHLEHLDSNPNSCTGRRDYQGKR